MAAPMEVQLRNAQSSLLFMQQEHAHTLQGLHTELQKLQKKCAELTFEIAMKSDNVDEDRYKEKQKLLESKLKDLEACIEEMQLRLHEKDRRILSLEQQRKVQEKKFQKDIKQRSQKMAALNNELDQKSTNIAYLTNQLHQMAMVRHKNRDTVLEDRVQVNSPQPPQRPPPSHRRRMRTPSIDSVTILNSGKVATALSESLDGLTKIDISSRYTKHLSPPNNTRSPKENELSAFVAKIDKQRSDVEIKPAPPILPPISPFGQELRTMPSISPSHNPYYSRRGIRVSKHRESEPAAINSLAVHTVHTTDLQTAQQSNGDST